MSLFARAQKFALAIRYRYATAALVFVDTRLC